MRSLMPIAVMRSALLITLASAVGSCTRTAATDTAALMATNPAGVCTAPETLSAIKDAIVSNFDLSSVDLPVYRDIDRGERISKYLKELSDGASVTVALAVLDNFDKETKKVSCSGTMTFTWPNDMVVRLNKIDEAVDNSSASSKMNYYIQPQADGKEFVYSVDRESTDAIQQIVTTILITLRNDDYRIAATAAANEAATTAAPNVASAPSSDTLPPPQSSEAAPSPYAPSPDQPDLGPASAASTPLMAPPS